MLADLPPLYRSACLQALIGQTLSLGELAPEVETIIANIQEQSNLTPLELDLIDRLQHALAQGQVLQGAWVPIRV
ncbi:hypothetical protein [Nodosilinea sp. P-1105]|uniref:hypothetical protein n=1 Tax=Nodosilinea sp. P-1105 TaxID=2546229 RepID=UPI00146B7341|nr:hypothetical protein [Nodosilinea sp. P-1105]NMF83092.1 hypothetical protein [Nodosilinea sp. P-1105]